MVCMVPASLLSSDAKPNRFVGLAIPHCVLLQASRALQRMNIDSAILQKLTNRRLFTARDLLIATHLELVEALDIPFQVAEELLLYVCNQIAPASSTVRIPRPTTSKLTAHPTRVLPPHEPDFCADGSCWHAGLGPSCEGKASSEPLADTAFSARSAA